MVADRHIDPRPFLFSTPERAVDEARTFLGEQMHPDDADDDELGEQPPPEGLLFHGRWSHEGDEVWVTACLPIDSPVVID